ncbi:MAG: RNA polymerase sigma factor [Polyangiaceae bacterium]|nr:RNA polymerase sigma factor [Polyangiaceae bacterium]
MSAARSKVVPLRPRREGGAEAGEARGRGIPSLEEALAVHLDAIYATALVLAGGRAAVAEDLVQETAVAAFRAWGSLRDGGAMKAWLLRITYRCFLDQRRRERRRPQVAEVELDALLEADEPEATAPLPAGGEELSERLESALQALPEGFRECLWLVDVEELTMAQAAGVLELPPGGRSRRGSTGRDGRCALGSRGRTPEEGRDDERMPARPHARRPRRAARRRRLAPERVCAVPGVRPAGGRARRADPRAAPALAGARGAARPREGAALRRERAGRAGPPASVAATSAVVGRRASGRGRARDRGRAQGAHRVGAGAGAGRAGRDGPPRVCDARRRPLRRRHRVTRGGD